MKKNISRRDFLKRTVKGMALAGTAGCSLVLQGCNSRKEYDLVIRDALVLDGRGSPGFRADLGLSADTIRIVGKVDPAKAKYVVEAAGRAVCPGFIDVHDHSDISLLVNPKAESLVHQGITTVVSGNCGSSPFPVADMIFEEQKARLKEQFGLEMDWREVTGFFNRLGRNGLAVNYATLVGHGAIRGAAMGFNDRPPLPEELEKMKGLTEDNIRAGAFGISTGLEYAPGSYAGPEEIVELCRVAAHLGGVYATHMRDEGDRLLESLDESIAVVRKSGAKLQISHFKVAYPRNWDKIDAALGRIEEADKEGIDIYCDRYPYIASSTGLSFYFPLWAKQGRNEEFLARLKDPALEEKLRSHVAEQEVKLGSWDKVLISSVILEKNRPLQGKSVLEAARESGKEPYDFMRDLIIEEQNQVGMIVFMMKEDNLKKILAHPLVGVGCDGSAVAPYGILGRGKPHPRNYGTFPRVLGKYVREERIAPLEEMIRKMTSVPAARFGFERRGAIEPGFLADLVVFDPERIADTATWVNPHQYPIGLDYVIVNGRVVIRNGDHTGDLPGRILKKKV